MDDEGLYAIALDGDKQPVHTVSSNPGHVLWCGLPSPDRARRTAQRLVADDMFSGWGLRTMSSRHPRYNPMAYQRGSVWPHDTMLCAAGMVRYGHDDLAAMLIQGMLEAACAFEASRLPELFCGIERELGGPVPYAEANVPQAWAAASAPLAAQLFLGAVPDAANGRCYLDPRLPDWLPRLEIDGVDVGGHNLRIVLARDGDVTVIDDLDADGVDVVVAKTSAALWGTVTM
jgi:glycogen debranching enzyme